MLRRFLIALCIVFGFTAAYAGPVANIEWVHGAINNIWGVEIPYHKDLKNSRYASNMEYLLNAVDRANYVINGFESTQYRNDKKYATKLAANVETAEEAINTLIREEVLVFRTLRTTTNFSIKIAAKGNFTIDWGDGYVQPINQTTTVQTTYSHNYDKAGVYYIRPRGKATEYNGDGFTPSIKIGTPTALATINGSLGSVFSTLSNGSQPSFYGTFAGCTNLRGKIPEDLFEGVHGQADKWYMFALLFDGCSKLEGPIPESLFASVTGKPVQGMFEATFRDCSSLKGPIPEKIFHSIEGDMTNYLFNMTFLNCSSLTGSIPGDLFKTITGQPGIAGFYKLFRNTGLTGSIPGTLFLNLDGESQESSFAETFASTKLSGRIPENLFKGVTGRPGPGAFWATFGSSRSLSGPIPEDLFASMSGAPRANSFRETFNRTGTCGNLPAGLFRTIQGAPADAVFYETFVDCGVNKIPAGLFDGIQGPPAPYMFYRTFHWNSLGSIPAGLFAGISGPPAPYMFYGTFDSTKGSGTIGAPLFGDIRGAAATNMFYATFNKSGGSLTGPSAQMAIKKGDGTTENHFIYEFWDMTSNQATYNSRASGMDDYACIPTTWGGPGTSNAAACLANWPFSIKTTSVSNFNINISAAGSFFIDWGDGKYDTIKKSATDLQSVSHNYEKAGVYTIRMSGIASDYAEGSSVVSFSTNSIAEIDGSIGKIFPTLSNGKNPVFAELFSNAVNLTGVIPDELFSGIVGQPVPGMFAYLFSNCVNLSGPIPGDLFAGLDGEPVDSMFESTFDGAISLSGGIPSGLFAGIKGEPAMHMFMKTFNDSAIEYIPANLFAGISGAPAPYMFMDTFANTQLTNLPEGLFAGIKGAPASGMYSGTFRNDIEIIEEIPLGFFGDISGASASDMFNETFAGCSNLKGASARDINGEFLYNIWPEEGVGTKCYGSNLSPAPTNLTDWNCIPESWGGPNTGNSPACLGNWPLTMTVEGTQFSMQFAFEGEAYVDWGDGKYETFDGLSSASHTYSTSGTYNVRIAANPTAYYGSDYPVFEITTPYALQKLHGSLGQVFPTLADGSNPAFIETFQEAVNLTTLPETLFDGLSGTAVPYMFESTFRDCTGLTELPTYLFEGVNVPAEGMFSGTFDNCTGLTSIPENLLSHLELGANPPEHMFENMFAGCTGLRGESAKINGMYLYDEYGMVPDVFTGMYLNCTGLTDYANIPMSWKSQAE